MELHLASAAHAGPASALLPPTPENPESTSPTNISTDPEIEPDSTWGQTGVTSGFLPLAPADYVSAKKLKRRPQLLTDLDLYPPGANQITERGKLIAHIFIGENGTVDTVVIQHSNLPPAFVEHVRTAFLKSHFTAGERGGRAVKSRIRIEVSVTSPEQW